MKKALLWITILFTIILTVTINAELRQKPNKLNKVYINQLVQHPALDETTRGIIEGLEKLGYKSCENIELKIENASGSAVNAAAISKKFVSQKADIIVGNPTVAAQSVLKYAKENKTKLIFTSVTDPLMAGLVKSINKPGNNTTGVSNFVPLEPQIELFQKILPNMKKIGFIYNPGEMNSISLIKQLEVICKEKNLMLVTQVASKSSDLMQATRSIVGRVDAIFISNDNTALSGLSTIVKEAGKSKIPVFTSDTDIVEQGAVAALGPNQYQVGLLTAKLIDQVLQGADINRLPVKFPDDTELVLNKAAAEKLGIKFTDELVHKAKTVLSSK